MIKSQPLHLCAFTCLQNLGPWNQTLITGANNVGIMLTVFVLTWAENIRFKSIYISVNNNDITDY